MGISSITLTITNKLIIDAWIEAANRNKTSPEHIIMEFIEWQGLNYINLFQIGHITSAAFIRRLSAEEYSNILNAAKQNPDINRLVDELVSNPVISLNDSRLITGLEFLVSGGLLQENRISELLYYERPEPIDSNIN